jgi:hypothetical protein
MLGKLSGQCQAARYTILVDPVKSGTNTILCVFVFKLKCYFKLTIL